MAVDTTALRRLRDNHKRLATALADMRARLEVHEQVLAEPLPCGGDHESATRRIAQAMAADARDGTSTATAVRTECEAHCRAADEALATARSRRETSAARRRECETAIAELEVMVEEADRELRAQVARAALALIPDAKARYYAAARELIDALAEWSAVAALSSEERDEQYRGVPTGAALSLPKCETSDRPDALGEFSGWASIEVTPDKVVGIASKRLSQLRTELLGEAA